MQVKVCEGVDWVGHVDWDVRDFHSYETTRGTTYNAYLIRDRKTALVDTVKSPCQGELLRKLAQAGPTDRPDYIVCNHAEPDHSGALPELLAAFPEAVVVCNKKCRAALGSHYQTGAWQFHVVSDGDQLPLGQRTLRFIDTPMVHWPESMFTYLPEEKLLFSMDAFGQHYATSGRFDDQVPGETLLFEAKQYYANIVMPYGKQVTAVLKKAASLEIETIAPAHGVIWRGRPAEILEQYREWSSGRVRAKVLVLYDSMWGSTSRMARAIAEGASRPGVEVQLWHLRRTGLTRVATESLDAAAVAFGSATLNREMMPAAAAALCYLKGLRPPKKAALAFGSYGWGRGGPEGLHAGLGELGWELLGEPLKAQYRPTDEVLAQCRQAGQLLADRAEQAAKCEHCAGTGPD